MPETGAEDAEGAPSAPSFRSTKEEIRMRSMDRNREKTFRFNGRGEAKRKGDGKTWRSIAALLLVFLLAAGAANQALAAGAWVCPACGHENPERAKFCGSCSRPRADAEIPEPVQTNAWVCSNCGEICPDGDTFCMICGGGRHDSDLRALMMPEREVLSRAMPSAEIRTFEGTFNQESKTMNRDFTAPVSGWYYVFLESAPKGLRAYCAIRDTKGYELQSDYLTQGGGFQVKLKAGEKYTLRAEQNRDPGSFRLAVGIPKEWQDLGDCTEITDSFLYQKQDNRYTITPQTSGIHTFWIGRAMKGLRFWLAVQDGQGYSLKEDYVTQNGGVSLRLKAGTTYYLHVGQNQDLGEYQLKIGRPRKTLEITGCSLIGGSIDYREEQNVYTFKAPKDGEYQFRLARADSGFRACVAVYDFGGYELGSEYIRQGGKTRVTLSAGATYTVKVIQNEGYGTYSLQISY